MARPKAASRSEVARGLRASPRADFRGQGLGVREHCAAHPLKLRLGGASPPLATVLRPLIARSYGATEAEATVEVAEAGPEPEAEGGAADPGEAAPAAPAQDTENARC